MAVTVLDTLKTINRYPVPLPFYLGTMAKRGLVGDTEVTGEVLGSSAYNLAVADILLWLSEAPNISQGGQSYSFTDEQRTQFRNAAYSLYKEFGDEEDKTSPKPMYGYKGNRL